MQECFMVGLKIVRSVPIEKILAIIKRKLQKLNYISKNKEELKEAIRNIWEKITHLNENIWVIIFLRIPLQNISFSRIFYAFW